MVLSGCGENELNPIQDEAKLDCENLRIRKVELLKFLNGGLRNKIHVTMENTCRTCEDDWVYLGLFMVDKITQDTVAATCGSCLTGVRNQSNGLYQLDTDLETLPDLKRIIFNYSYLCEDVPYQP